MSRVLRPDGRAPCPPPRRTRSRSGRGCRPEDAFHHQHISESTSFPSTRGERGYRRGRATSRRRRSGRRTRVHRRGAPVGRWAGRAVGRRAGGTRRTAWRAAAPPAGGVTLAVTGPVACDDGSVTVIAAVGTALGAHPYDQETITAVFGRHVVGRTRGRGPCSTAARGAGVGPGTWRCRSRTTRRSTASPPPTTPSSSVGRRARRRGRPRRARRGRARAGRRRPVIVSTTVTGVAAPVARRPARRAARAARRTSSGCRCSGWAASPARPASPGCTTTCVGHPDDVAVLLVGRAVLADRPARRHLDGEPGGQRPVRRRRRGRRDGRRGAARGASLGLRRAEGPRDPQPRCTRTPSGVMGWDIGGNGLPDRAGRRGRRPGASGTSATTSAASSPTTA